MKSIYIIRLSVLLLLTNLSFCQNRVLGEQNEDGTQKEKPMEYNMSFYNIKMKNIDGKEISFDKLKGKKVLIVNTASNCGYTRQYSELQDLYKKHGGPKGKLEIIAVPSNDFGEQEPGSNGEIKYFCSEKYGVTFPVMTKSVVKGKEMCELYQFLTQYSKNNVLDSTVEWNFQKYLINEDGNLFAMLPSSTSPMSAEIDDWLNNK